MDQADPADSTIEPYKAAQEEFLSQPKQSNANLKDDIAKLPKEIRNLIAGGLAGMVAKTVVAPFDRIKILYQISSAEFHILDVPRVANKIIQTEGVRALWKGNLATMVRVFPYSGIQFMVFDRCKMWLLHDHQRQYEQRKAVDPSTKKPKWGLSPSESLIAGMLAGGTSVIATYPLDLVRAQLAVLKKNRNNSNGNFVRVLILNYKNGGVSGLFRGITPTLLGILPYSGIAFSLNEQAKRKIQNMTGRDLTTLERVQCGALSGLFAQTMTYPLEVTRRRMQTIGIVATSKGDTALSALEANNKKATSSVAGAKADGPHSMVSIMQDLYKEQGIRGFFKGVSMNWFKGPIAFSISFTTFDSIQKFIETEAERSLRLPRRWTTRPSR